LGDAVEIQEAAAVPFLVLVVPLNVVESLKYNVDFIDNNLGSDRVLPIYQFKVIQLRMELHFIPESASEGFR
jgi:hypothetical protein